MDENRLVGSAALGCHAADPEYIEAQLGRLRMQADAIDVPLLAYMIEQAMAEARSQQKASE